MRTPKIPVVINENQQNKYGAPRGYKIQLNRPLLNLETEGYARSKALGELFCCERHDQCVTAPCDAAAGVTTWRARVPCSAGRILQSTGD